MLHQVIDIQQENRYLSQERGFLKISEKNTEIGRVPLDDIAVLLVSAQSATFSKHILTELSERGAVSVLCGKNYAPQATVLPVSGHYLQAGIIKTQIECTEPFKKNIWKQIIERKLVHQAKSLEFCKKKDEAKLLYKISRMVKSGDTDNREAYGAKMYWNFLFGENFKRDKDADGINAVLNYGYAVVRSSMSRAIVSAGLLPSLGIHHDNKLNPFCLSDDLFEPYRPIVDTTVYQLIQTVPFENEIMVTPEIKKILAQMLWYRLSTAQGKSPLFQSMQYMVNSLVTALNEKNPIMEIPVWEELNDTASVEQV